jgi:hypothetical protein
MPMADKCLVLSRGLAPSLASCSKRWYSRLVGLPSRVPTTRGVPPPRRIPSARRRPSSPPRCRLDLLPPRLFTSIPPPPGPELHRLARTLGKEAAGSISDEDAPSRAPVLLDVLHRCGGPTCSEHRLPLPLSPDVPVPAIHVTRPYAGPR